MLCGLRRFLETWNTLRSRRTTKCVWARSDGATKASSALAWMKAAPERLCHVVYCRPTFGDVLFLPDGF